MVGAGALIHHRGRVLLVKRRHPPNRGRWALPGGLVELGEDVEDAVLREVKEELGILVKLEALLDVATDIHLDEDSRVKYHYVLVDYLATPLGTAVKLNEESSAFRWFTPAEAELLDMSDATRRVVASYRAMTADRPHAFGRSTMLSRKGRPSGR